MDWDKATRAFLVACAIGSGLFIAVRLIDTIRSMLTDGNIDANELTVISILVAPVGTFVGAMAGYLAGYQNGKGKE